MPAMLSYEEVVDRLQVMRLQEQTSYAYRSYLPHLPHLSSVNLNGSWREKICQWSYNVVDHFELSREVVDVSMSLFDRYLATRANECSGNLALLTSLTTLHIAIKLNDTKQIKITTLAGLSRGQFRKAEIEEMERNILPAIGWKLHPPTNYGFVSHFMLLLPQEVNLAVRKEIFSMSRYLTELAVCDTYFLEVESSTLSFAAILNAMEEIGYGRLSAGFREKFLRSIADTVGLTYYSTQVVACRERLHSMFQSAPSPQQVLESVIRLQNSSHNNSDNNSLSASSISSAGSVATTGNRSRSNSMDGKITGCRYSPASRRRYSLSPIGRVTTSPMLASIL